MRVLDELFARRLVRMDRRNLLQSLLLSPVAFLRSSKMPAPTHLRDVPRGAYDAPYGADLRTGEGECLPEVRWASLSPEQQHVLAFASGTMDGNAGAVFPIDFPSHPHWSPDRTGPGDARRKAQDSLYRLGLLTFTSKVPEHRYDLCGWYTITQYGREIVPLGVRVGDLLDLAKARA